MKRNRKTKKLKQESSTAITIPAGITHPISASDLSQSTGLSVEQCQTSLDELVEVGVLEKLDQDLISGKYRYQIVDYQDDCLERLKRLGVIS